MEQALERNPTKPQKPDHPLPEFFLQVWYSTSQFLSSYFSVAPSPKISAIFPRKALLYEGTAERKKERKEEMKENIVARFCLLVLHDSVYI